MTITLPVASIKFAKEFYPRQKPDDQVIRRYRDAIDELPPIEVAHINGEYLGVDGYHRVLAHKLENRSELQAILREDLTTANAVLAEAIRLNAKHGHQLIREDKERLAQQLFGTYTVEQLASLLAVSTRTIREWTRQQRQMAEFERDVKALSLYLGGQTEEEIAKQAEVAGKSSIAAMMDRYKNGKVSEIVPILSAAAPDDDTAAQQSIVKQYLGNHLLDPTKPPPSLKVYDVWNFSICDEHYGAQYPGRIPGQILENLLWYYTKPFDNVYDPFAGSGTTIDVCRAMFRRNWSSDLRPFDETKGIHRHDITRGKPDFFPKGYKMDLIFLDPPYWSMKDAEYVDGSISSLTLKEYYETMAGIGETCLGLAADGGILALLIQNQTGEGKGGFEGYLDHAFALFGRYQEIGWAPLRRISCPMPPDNHGGANEAKAKADRRMLGLVRDLLMFQKR